MQVRGIGIFAIIFLPHNRVDKKQDPIPRKDEAF
jgi:hypothetical protein